MEATVVQRELKSYEVIIVKREYSLFSRGDQNAITTTVQNTDSTAKKINSIAEQYCLSSKSWLFSFSYTVDLL